MSQFRKKTTTTKRKKREKAKKKIKAILLQETTCQLYKEYQKMALELHKQEFASIWASLFLSTIYLFWKAFYTREGKYCLMSATLPAVISLPILGKYKVISYYFSRATDTNLVLLLFFLPYKLHQHVVLI